MNTVEATVVFLPALWLFAAFVSGMWSAAFGVVWLAARIWYAAAYQKAAALRAPAFTISTLMWVALMLGAAWGVVVSFLR